ncbi:hypothetical protein [Nocardia sp. NPDC052112]|uniref:hypothetical protein n=1 Tax=Nocardia sp. NPDC052112 TaxID=3155646 RepID=UPI00344A3E97
MPEPDQQSRGHCRVRILDAGLRLDFRATIAQAHNFADAMGKWSSELSVCVDHDSDIDLPPLPCARLWSHPRFAL